MCCILCLQHANETEAKAMIRIMEAGPSLWQSKREALARRAHAIHERAAFCAKTMMDWAMQISKGDTNAARLQPHEALSTCYRSVSVDDWRQ